MSRFPLRTSAVIACFVVVSVGCHPTQPMYLNDTGDLSYYLDQATAIEYPDVESTPLAEVSQAQPPITVLDPDFRSFFDLTLEECVGIALQNSKVIRGYGTPSLQGARVSPGIDNLSNGPQGAGTFYNIAIRETEPGFIGTAGQLSSPGQITTNTGLETNQGVEAALADFDTQFTSNLFWTRTDEPRNTVAPFDRTAFEQDQVQFQTEFAKKTATGTQLLARNVNVYTANNIPLQGDGGFQILPSTWRTALEFEIRQPLLRGRGAFINRMPIVISRIGTDQELANLEAQLQNMVTNVEIRYWDLHLAYRNLEASKDGRDAALETWRIVYDNYTVGSDVNIQQVAQASEQYHFFDEQVIDAYNSLLSAESNLRFLMGIASTDGQILRPIDEPVLAPLEFDWCSLLDEALCWRPEIRQQRWELKKRELAVAYAKNSLLPEMNVTALYRWLGLGDNLVADQNNAPNFPQPRSGAWDTLWEGDFQELQFGGEFRMPVGFRRELANVRNSQLKLAREFARLEDMELDVTRELADTVRALDANRRIMQSAFNRWADTTTEKQHFIDLKDAGVETLDVALDAQRRLAQAEIAFYSALVEYNKVIALMHRRKGTTLAYNSICFTEGPWTGKAYQDASEEARRRGAARPLNYGWSRPEVISAGPVWPSDGNDGTGRTPAQTIPVPTSVEGLPAGPVNTFPYYQPEMSVPADQGQPAESILVPGTSDPATSLPVGMNTALPASPIYDPGVQQASWNRSAADPAPPGESGRLRNALDRVQTSIQPPRDSRTAPLTGMVMPPSTAVDPANVDWSRFGIAPPSSGPPGVSASLRVDTGTGPPIEN
jgi:outer membrane protein TolC